MERNNRDRGFYGEYNNDRNRFNRYDNRGRDIRQEFEGNFQNNRRHEYHDDSDNDNFFDNDRFRDYSERDYDMEHDYYDSMRGDEGRLGDIRQGYGISSFDGTSDRYNTLNNMQRERNAQEGQLNYSGNRDGFRSSRFGGGLRDSSVHSNRGVPNYGTRNFSHNTGTGMGSTYGGTNYGGGTGYVGGHHGGSFGNSSYGTSAGNYGGYGSMGNSSYGSGRSSFGESSGHSDRGNFDDSNF